MIKFLALACLAGCGGGGDDPGSGIDPRVARIDAYDMQRLRVLGDAETGVAGMDPTPAVGVPVVGSADFDGFATIRVENTAAPLVLYGDSVVTISFAQGSVTGTMDAFFGTNDSGALVDYTGTITIDAGAVSPDLSFDYAGALTEGANTLVFDGTLTGMFLGDPLAALAASELDAAVYYNGTLVDATFVVVGETVLSP
ncbi:hypothetical protein [Yoonia tamlensis]|uniref:hypothetical protein n=1 Tax=Yoonia tamlensis TaxID=390270 RepID=UPI001041DCD4|nr:hypothetical protein [Yoonia tamlensis]